MITLPYSFSQTYLIPQARKSAGITEEQVSIHDASLSVLIKSYCRESGVRNLQKHVEKVIIHEEQNYVIKVLLHIVDIAQCCRFQNRFWKLATCCRKLEVALCAMLYDVDFEHNNCRIKPIAIDHKFLWFIG